MNIHALSSDDLNNKTFLASVILKKSSFSELLGSIEMSDIESRINETSIYLGTEAVVGFVRWDTANVLVLKPKELWPRIVLPELSKPEPVQEEEIEEVEEAPVQEEVYDDYVEDIIRADDDYEEEAPKQKPKTGCLPILITFIISALLISTAYMYARYSFLDDHDSENFLDYILNQLGITTSVPEDDSSSDSEGDEDIDWGGLAGDEEAGDVQLQITPGVGDGAEEEEEEIPNFPIASIDFTFLKRMQLEMYDKTGIDEFVYLIEDEQYSTKVTDVINVAQLANIEIGDFDTLWNYLMLVKHNTHWEILIDQLGLIELHEELEEEELSRIQQIAQALLKETGNDLFTSLAKGETATDRKAAVIKTANASEVLSDDDKEFVTLTLNSIIGNDEWEQFIKQF